MNDRQLKRLMDMMHSLSDSVLSGHDVLHDPETYDQKYLDMAQKLHDESALKLALVASEFINEMIDRRHKTANFQYPLEPFDEWRAGKK